MNIRLVSSITPDDEERFAPMILTTITSFLDQLSIVHTLRIETSGGVVFEAAHPACATDPQGRSRRAEEAAAQA